MARTTTIYLTNKELLSEIHKSKMTYVQIDNPDYYMYDTIVYDLDVFLDDDVCTEHYGEWNVEYTMKEDPKTAKEDPKTVNEDPVIIKDTISNLWAFNRHKDAPKRNMISTELIKSVTTEEYIQTVKQNKAKKINKNAPKNKYQSDCR